MSDASHHSGDLPPDKVTLGELVRWLGGIERRMEQGFQNVQRQIENQQYVSVGVYQAERVADRERIHQLEGELRSQRRAVITALLGMAASALIALASIGSQI